MIAYVINPSTKDVRAFGNLHKAEFEKLLGAGWVECPAPPNTVYRSFNFETGDWEVDEIADLMDHKEIAVKRFDSYIEAMQRRYTLGALEAIDSKKSASFRQSLIEATDKEFLLNVAANPAKFLSELI